MKKVISISLFGDGDKYSRYLPAFLRAHHNLFPRSEGWALRVHVDDIHHEFLDRLELAGLIEARYMHDPAELTKAMLWRLAPIFGEDEYHAGVTDVEYVFCRDLDALPMPRDRAACEQFIQARASGAVTHTIHDNIMHEGLMGGLCGFHVPSFREHTGFTGIHDLYKAGDHANWAKHGTDQIVLNALFLRRSGPKLFEHRYNGWANGKAGQNPPRKAGTYLCPAISCPVPEFGQEQIGIMESVRDKNDREKLIALFTKADTLANHLGSAGYDYEAAVAFWDEHGNPDITKAIRECERA